MRSRRLLRLVICVALPLVLWAGLAWLLALLLGPLVIIWAVVPLVLAIPIWLVQYGPWRKELRGWPAAPEASAIRFHKNAPGDFYTTGECMACGLPEEFAPECLAPLVGENCDTYFLRQPVTPEEIDHVCEAVESCCVVALRYGGHDPAIRARLGGTYCDE